jgi:hypothetical protein
MSFPFFVFLLGGGPGSLDATKRSSHFDFGSSHVHKRLEDLGRPRHRSPTSAFRWFTRGQEFFFFIRVRQQVDEKFFHIGRRFFRLG